MGFTNEDQASESPEAVFSVVHAQDLEGAKVLNLEIEAVTEAEAETDLGLTSETSDSALAAHGPVLDISDTLGDVVPDGETDEVIKELEDLKLNDENPEETKPQKKKWPKKVKAPETPLYLKGSDQPIEKEQMERYHTQRLAVKASDAYLKVVERLEEELSLMTPVEDWEDAPSDIEEVEAPFYEPSCPSGIVEPPVPWSDEPEVPEVKAPAEPEPEPVIDSWLLIPTPNEDEDLEEESDISTKQNESESSDFSDSDELLATYARCAKFVKASSPDS